jgi:outer membrane protein assembly factor BamB
MTDDFVTRLQLQLREAAERQARAGALTDAFRRARWRLTAPAMAAAVAVALAALAVAAGTMLLRSEPEPATPRVVAKVELTGNPGWIVPAFGSVWISDSVAGDVVRVDPDTRRVLARIPVGSAQVVVIQPVGGELWVMSDSATVIERIDPGTDAVSGRVRLRTPDGRPFPALDVLASSRGVWAVGNEGALLLDPETGAGRTLVAAPTAESDASFFSLGDQYLWSLRSDGRILRFDAATGKADGGFVSPLPTEAIVAFGPDLMAGSGGTVARLDGQTGRELWRRTLGSRHNASLAASGLIWIAYSSAVRGDPDWLVAIAADSGKTVTSTALDTFGASGLAIVGRDVWLNTAGGQTLVLRR